MRRSRWTHRLHAQRGRLALAAVVLVLVELLLRSVGYSDQVFTQPDPVLGYRLIPGLSQLQTIEGRAVVTINEDGYRGRAYPRERRPGTLRVVVLGDSLTESRQVGDEETYPAVAERKLRACSALAGRGPEVLNFGVAGYSNAQELLLYRERARLWSPDLVLLMVYVPNDLEDNTTGARRRHQPWFDLVDGRLVLDQSFRDSRSFRIASSPPARAFAQAKRHVRVLHLFGGALRHWRNWRVSAPSGGSDGRPLYLDPDGTFGPPVDDREWRLLERLVLQLSAEVAASGARFMLANAPSPHAVHADRGYREDVQRFYAVANLDYAERRLSALAAAASIRFVPLAEPLRSEAERTGQCVSGFANAVPCFGHWNPLGNRIVGEQVAHAICQGLLSPGAHSSVPNERQGRSTSRANPTTSSTPIRSRQRRSPRAHVAAIQPPQGRSSEPR